MNIKQACLKFDRWEYPWEFIDDIKESLKKYPDQLALAEKVWDEANDRTFWMNIESLSQGTCDIEKILIQKFTQIDEVALRSFARSASYNWR